MSCIKVYLISTHAVHIQMSNDVLCLCLTCSILKRLLAAVIFPMLHKFLYADSDACKWHGIESLHSFGCSGMDCMDCPSFCTNQLYNNFQFIFDFYINNNLLYHSNIHFVYFVYLFILFCLSMALLKPLINNISKNYYNIS